MKLGATHFDGTADAPFVRITLVPSDDLAVLDKYPGKKIIPVLRFREQKKQPDTPDFITGTELTAWINKLATAYPFEYVCVSSEMNDASQWAGTPQEYFDMFHTIQDEWKRHSPITLVCDGGLQSTAIVKNKVQAWEPMWAWTDQVNFHHFQDLKSIAKTVEHIRSKIGKGIICTAAGVKKSVGRKVTMTAKIEEMNKQGVELLIWFAGDGDDANQNVWTLPKYLAEFNACYAATIN